MSEETDQADSLRRRVTGPPTPPERPAAATPLRVIAVTSGKGGVGKTNISANLAVLAARRGLRVLVIDADLGLANVEIVYGIKPRYHLGDLLDSSLTVRDVLAEGPHGVKVLSAGSGIQSLTKITEAQKLQFVAAMESIEEMFDLVLIDTGAGIGDNVLFFVGAAQEALLIVSPEPTSLVDAYAVVKVLSQQAGVRHFSVVVNPVVDELPAREIFHKLTAVTSRFLSAKVRHLGYVPRDENLHRAIMAQRPVVDLFPLSPASRALGVIAEKLFAEPVAPAVDGGLKLMWNRLFREASASPR
jgi:flagellar biosynthesis protein FlhG